MRYRFRPGIGGRLKIRIRRCFPTGANGGAMLADIQPGLSANAPQTGFFCDDGGLHILLPSFCKLW